MVLERTRRDLDQLGRRQGMTGAVAALAFRFLKLLRTWFAEIERVTESSGCMNFRWTDGVPSRSSGSLPRPGSERRLSFTALAKAEADSPDRRQQRLARRAVQFPAQVANMDIDHVALGVEVHIPYFL